MATRNTRTFLCSPDDVFAVLGDGWLYPTWVVGAARMRAVDPEWPEEGSRLHHSLGVWPLLFNDTTEIVEWDPPRRIRLRAKAGPLGRAVIVIEVRERGEGCVVRIGEEPVGGAAAIPKAVWGLPLRARNKETLRRLAFLAEGRRLEREHGEESARPEVPEADDPSQTASPQAASDVVDATDASDAAGAPTPHPGTFHVEAEENGRTASTKSAGEEPPE